MTETLMIITLTALAGSCIALGGIIASFEQIHSNWLEAEFRHFVIALGGGTLLGAVSLILIPEGLEGMRGSLFAIPAFLLGGLTFFLIEKRLGLRRRESPQLMGMILDYIPEAMALGGLIAFNPSAALLLAVLIGLQNLPEGFNAYRELNSQNSMSTKKALLTMLALIPLGPLAGLSGYYFLAENQEVLAAIMLFSSGGILYLIFQDIAPQSRLEKHWGPPLGAVFGVCLALLGEMLTN